MPSLLDISILVAGGLFLPILLPCFLQGPLPVFDGLLPGVMDSNYLAHPMTEHVFLIDMGKNLTLVLLCAWAYLQTSVATKKAVATLIVGVKQIQGKVSRFVRIPPDRFSVLFSTFLSFLSAPRCVSTLPFFAALG